MAKYRHVGPRLDIFVERALASQDSYSEVVDAGVKLYRCAESTVKEAIARVRARWRSAGASTVDERRGKFLADIEFAWRMALIEGDYRAIAQLAKTRADVEGIRAPKQVQVSGTLGLKPVEAMSPQEREREIAELLARRARAIATGAPLALPEPVTETADEMVPDIRPPAKRATRKKAGARKKPSTVN